MTCTARRSLLRRAVQCALPAAALALGHSLALAQKEPIRLIVPLTTGSLVDTVARGLSNELSRATGRPVVVENLPGAGGITGTSQLVRAPKDGSTIALVSSNHVINPSIYKSIPFDSMKDVTPITLVCASTMVLVVNPSVQAKNAAELIKLAKDRPGQLYMASSGNGTTLHLAGELFNTQAKVSTTHVPYKGQGPQMTDIIGGQVQMGFLAVATATPHVQAGKLRAIGVSSKTRSPVLPDVPTLAESGLPDYELDSWVALIAPAGLLRGTVDGLHKAFQTALASKEVQSAFAAQGVAVKTSTPEETRAFFEREQEKYAQIIKQSGIKAD
jgi:tripartite-type tricarboxylate transporter receptor subunit TctC